MTSVPSMGTLRLVSSNNGEEPTPLRTGDSFSADEVVEYTPLPGIHGLPLDNFTCVARPFVIFLKSSLIVL